MENTRKIHQKMQNTTLCNEESIEKVGQIIRAEFDRTDDEQRAFDLLVLAYNLNVPQFDQMLSQYSIEDFKWLGL